MGDLLELGPQRDMEPHYMVCLRSLSACKGYQGLEREEGGLCRHLWLFINCLSLLGCKFCPAGPSCLRIMNNPKNAFVFIFRGNCKILLKDKEKPVGQNTAYSFTYVSIWTDGFDAVFDKICNCIFWDNR